MARVEFSGIDELLLSLKEVAELPDEVIDAMLDARADVVVAAQRQAAERMLKGPYDTGETARSIKKGKPKLRDSQRVLYVTPTGSRKRGKAKAVRNAEIAFINEYGTRKIPARNFIRTANESCADAAVAAEFEVYSRYLEEKGL
jgi:HK97 gp10 family phage protein